MATRSSISIPASQGKVDACLIREKWREFGMKQRVGGRMAAAAYNWVDESAGCICILSASAG